MKRRSWLLIFIAIVVLLASQSVFADAGTFSNPAAISIPDSGPASPFPSNISVSALSGNIIDVNVTIYNFSHTCVPDTAFLLVGPGGQKVTLLARLGSSQENCGGVEGVTVTFDDQAATIPPVPLMSGTYQPYVDPNAGPVDFSGYGGPAGPYGAALSDFNGTNPNGTWSLYVVDQVEGDQGIVAGGWSISIVTDTRGTASCTINIPATAVVGTMTYPQQAFYAPGKLAPQITVNAGSYYVLGLDQSGDYYLIVVACQYLWVPSESMTPNYDAIWQGRPLPTIVYSDNAAQVGP